MSKGLEALESIKDSFKFNVHKLVYNANKNDFKIIEKELIDGEKNKKTLEIIKPFLKNIRLEENEKDEYEILIDVINSDKPLVIARVDSKKQFELLKEVML